MGSSCAPTVRRRSAVGARGPVGSTRQRPPKSCGLVVCADGPSVGARGSMDRGPLARGTGRRPLGGRRENEGTEEPGKGTLRAEAAGTDGCAWLPSAAQWPDCGSSCQLGFAASGRSGPAPCILRQNLRSAPPTGQASRLSTRLGYARPLRTCTVHPAPSPSPCCADRTNVEAGLCAPTTAPPTHAPPQVYVWSEPRAELL